MEIKSKICSLCKADKLIVEFNKRKLSKDGHRSECRTCQSTSKNKWFADNKERELCKAKSPEQREKRYKWYTTKYNNDPEWRAKQLKSNSEYGKSESGLKKRREWYNIPNNKIASNMRSRIRQAIKNNTKFGKSLDLLGADIDTTRAYIESKFREGMTWDNHGEWHIDHIIPCNFFDFSIEEHQLICFNYKNLQPMWASENFSKSDNITIDDIQDHIDNIRKTLNGRHLLEHHPIVPSI